MHPSHSQDLVLLLLDFLYNSKNAAKDHRPQKTMTNNAMDSGPTLDSAQFHCHTPFLPQFVSSELSPQWLIPSQRLPLQRHTRSFRQRKFLVGGHRNFPTGGRMPGLFCLFFVPQKTFTFSSLVLNSFVYTYGIRLGFRPSYHRSHPRRRTSMPVVCTECCYTGTRRWDRGARLRWREGERETKREHVSTNDGCTKMDSLTDCCCISGKKHAGFGK